MSRPEGKRKQPKANEQNDKLPAKQTDQSSKIVLISKQKNIDGKNVFEINVEMCRNIEKTKNIILEYGSSEDLLTDLAVFDSCISKANTDIDV